MYNLFLIFLIIILIILIIICIYYFVQKYNYNTEEDSYTEILEIYNNSSGKIRYKLGCSQVIIIFDLLLTGHFFEINNKNLAKYLRNLDDTFFVISKDNNNSVRIISCKIDKIIDNNIKLSFWDDEESMILDNIYITFRICIRNKIQIDTPEIPKDEISYESCDTFSYESDTFSCEFDSEDFDTLSIVSRPRGNKEIDDMLKSINKVEVISQDSNKSYESGPESSKNIYDITTYF
jgi:hypothetical protein